MFFNSHLWIKVEKQTIRPVQDGERGDHNRYSLLGGKLAQLQIVQPEGGGLLVERFPRLHQVLLVPLGHVLVGGDVLAVEGVRLLEELLVPAAHRDGLAVVVDLSAAVLPQTVHKRVEHHLQTLSLNQTFIIVRKT